MPIGDPHGGLFEYTVEGIPECVFAFTVPVSDIGRSVDFYTNILGLKVLGRTDSEAYLIRGSCHVILRLSENVGIDTGVYMGVDSPYNTRRRLIDEDVEFALDPVRGPFGTCTSFRDPDGNILYAIEQDAEFRLG